MIFIKWQLGGGWIAPWVEQQIRDKWAAIEAAQLPLPPAPAQFVGPVYYPPDPEPEPDEPLPPIIVAPPLILGPAPSAPPPPAAPPPVLDFVTLSEAAPAPVIAPLDLLVSPDQTAQMPTGSAPTVGISFVPPNVFAGQTLRILWNADDPDRNLRNMGLRWQGRGIIDAHDVPEESSRLYTFHQYRTEITAPDSGPLFFRVEAFDREGNGTTGEWNQVTVIPESAPALEEVNNFVRIVDMETNTPGIHQAVIQVDADAPDLVKAAVLNAQSVAQDLMGYSAGPGWLYEQIQTQYLTLAAESEAAGVNVAALDLNRERETTRTVVGHESGNLVYQQVTGAGLVEQWTERPDGSKSRVIIVDDLGVYEPPVLPQLVQPVVPVGGGAPIPGSGQTSAAVSPDFDPTQRLVGYDNQGRRVYRLVDQAGNVIQWSVEGSGNTIATTIQNLGPKNSAEAYFSSGPTTATADNAAKSPWLWLAGAAALAFALSRNRRN